MLTRAPACELVLEIDFPFGSKITAWTVGGWMENSQTFPTTPPLRCLRRPHDNISDTRTLICERMGIDPVCKGMKVVTCSFGKVNSYLERYWRHDSDTEPHRLNAVRTVNRMTATG